MNVQKGGLNPDSTVQYFGNAFTSVDELEDATKWMTANGFSQQSERTVYVQTHINIDLIHNNELL
jgi:hypothetical protein